jgi:hypothetical protein
MRIPGWEIIAMDCRHCGGSGRCPTCNAQEDKQKVCRDCFYLGLCHDCGGTGREIVSTRIPYEA